MTRRETGMLILKYTRGIRQKISGKAMNTSSRYNTTSIYWHTVIGPDGRTDYWLNPDWQSPYPGGPAFVDNGSF